MSPPFPLPIREPENASNPHTNFAAKGIPYFTAAQNPPSGTALEEASVIPKLFQPLNLRGLTVQNRMWLSPMCQYSAHDGHLSPWHMAHIGGIITRGPGLSIIEAAAVLPTGRITPEDVGIWSDSHLHGPYGLTSLVTFAHSQSQKIGIQLAHAGRKASTVAPWLGDHMATASLNGWPAQVSAPSAIKHTEDSALPHEMTLAEIEEFKNAWRDGVRRAIKAGFDTIEIHNAHGYLLHQFLSPTSNQRTDHYGGTFTNRVRLPLEIARITRAEMPESMPLLVRISGTDWLESNPAYEGESWTLAQSCEFAALLADVGVDVLDVSSGMGHPLQKIAVGPGYQVRLAKEIKRSLVEVGKGMLVTAVGNITSGKQAEAILTGVSGGEDDVGESVSMGEQELDAVFVGRPFLKDPGLVWRWAEELGTDVRLANQIRWGFKGVDGGWKKAGEKKNVGGAESTKL